MEKRAEDILKKYEQSMVMIILQCMSELPFDMGPTRLCEVLRGSRARHIREKELDENSMYNVLSHHNKDHVIAVINAMKEHRLINAREHAVLGTGEVLSISRYGRRVVDGQDSLDLGIITRRQTSPVHLATNPSPTSEVDSEFDSAPLKTPYQQRLDRIRATYPRVYESWNEEEEQKLRTMLTEGAAVKAIADCLQRQPGAIRSRIKKLDLVVVSMPQSSKTPQAIKPRKVGLEATASDVSPERRSRIRRRPGNET